MGSVLADQVLGSRSATRTLVSPAKGVQVVKADVNPFARAVSGQQALVRPDAPAIRGLFVRLVDPITPGEPSLGDGLVEKPLLGEHRLDPPGGGIREASVRFVANGFASGRPAQDETAPRATVVAA